MKLRIGTFILVTVGTLMLPGCDRGQNSDPPKVIAEKKDAKIGKAPEEDPTVLEYFKKKNWPFGKDTLLLDGRRLNTLFITDPMERDEAVTLTADDCKMIARAKTVQLLDLTSVKKLSDDNLKSVIAIATLDTIVLGGEELTDAGIAELAQSKSLAAVSLTKSKKVTDAGMKMLAKCESLELVDLEGNERVTDSGVKELAALPKLKSLHIRFASLEGKAFAAFAGSKSLETIHLKYLEGLTDEGVKTIAKIPKLKDLRIESGFGGSNLTSASIKAIVDARLPDRFDFDKKLIDDSLFESLVAKGWLYGPTPATQSEKRPASAKEVRQINLEGSKVTDKGFRAVLDCTNVESLYLSNTGIGDETFKKLTGFKKLTSLSLQKCAVSGAGLDAVSALPITDVAMSFSELSEDMFKAFGKMRKLETLALYGSKLDPIWLKHIATSSSIKALSLFDTDLDDAAAKHLAGIKSLESIEANRTKLGDVGFHELLKLSKLKSLSVSGSAVTEAAYLKAKKEHPKLSLYH